MRSLSEGQIPKNFPIRAWYFMNCMCSPTLVDFITYFGVVGACGMHLPGTQFQDAFGCDNSTSISMFFPLLCSSCSKCSLRCRGGSKEGLLALTPSISLAVAFRYEGFFTPLSEVILCKQYQPENMGSVQWCLVQRYLIFPTT
jgi:hypothetical protein